MINGCMLEEVTTETGGATMWETFNPTTGKIRWTVPFRWLAKWLALHDETYWEYSRKGEGWL